ncbi:septum formation initiator family protein [Egicoccus sp. AB-alg6-2]|uniref:FtsB family cell division protein n=1 Tax=Egicoccus sp. AB-alg6-2 TaxID=3242692 RepID=UPI00359CE628
MTSQPSRSHARRDLRRQQRRRRRGGHDRGPVALQRAADRSLAAARGVRHGVRRAVSGDRPLVLMLLGAIVLSVLMLSGPAQRYLDTRERVDALAGKADALDRANAELLQRQRDLQDPINIELLAREHQGFIRPGEVPYTLIPPEVERPRITAPRSTVQAPSDAAWYERMWETVHGWVGSS